MTAVKTIRWRQGTTLLAAYLSIWTAGSACAQTAGEAESTAAAESRVESGPKKLRIRTFDPDGEPAAGVDIGVNAASGQLDHYFTDESGQVEIELPDLEYPILRMWVRKSGYVPLFADWNFRRNPDLQVPTETSFRLIQGAVIGGVVKGDDGQPIAGASVEVTLNNRLQNNVGDQAEDSRLGTATTDENGRWELDTAPAREDAEFELELSHPDNIDIEDGRDLRREQKLTTQALRDQSAVVMMQKGVNVNGIVADPDGNPVAGATVAWGDELSFQYPAHRTHTGPDGTFRFSQLSSGKLQLTVLANGWAPQVIEVDVAPGMPPADFVLEPGSRLQMRIVDGAGIPVPDVRVQVDEWDHFESPVGIVGAHPLNELAPDRANENGHYEWPRAPKGSIKFLLLGKAGFAATEARLSADGTVHTVVMHPVLVIAGKVTDAETGAPIESFNVPQVHYFRPDFLFVNRSDAGRGKSGKFRMEFSRTDIDHGVWIEAMGYRTQLLGPWKIGESVEALDIRMEPAEPIRGTVVDTDGKQVADATVCLGTHMQHMDIVNHELGDTFSDVFSQQTDSDGQFSFPAQYEPYSLVVIHDSGYAEIERQPDEQPGELKLKAWCQVEGRLLQEGEPVAGERIRLTPIRPRYFPQPRISETFSTTTDADGRYEFKRVPPVASSLQARLSVWEDSPLGSSQLVPLDLQPGDQRVVDLGGNGATVTGHVRLAGNAARQIELHYSLNYLLRMAPGIEPPESVAKLGFDWREGWSPSWAGTNEGAAYQQTLHHYFVKLDGDGAFRVSGVPAGDYELALKIYEPPTEGCLVYPVGTRVVKFHVSDADIERGSLELGDVEVAATLGPKPGDTMPDIELTQTDGTTMRLSDFRGRPVLLDVWATWCGPCVASLPKVRALVENRAAESGLVVLGLSVDADKEAAREFLDKRNLPWPQVLLGDWDETPVPEQLGISSVPAYFLIDAEGVLVERGFTLETVVEKLKN